MEPKFLWILDNGHGRGTAGKHSPVLEDGRQFFEYEFNRIIVSKIVKKMKSAGLKYHVLVPEVDGDVSLQERVGRANSLQSDKVKLYLSIHSNAQSDNWGSASGIETYCYHKPSRSERLAKCFQNNLIKTTKWKDRGVKTANFYVIKNTKMPAVLTETGFYSNKEECLKLLDPAWQEVIAEAHFKSIIEIENIGVNF